MKNPILYLILLSTMFTNSCNTDKNNTEIIVEKKIDSIETAKPQIEYDIKNELVHIVPDPVVKENLDVFINTGKTEFVQAIRLGIDEFLNSGVSGKHIDVNAIRSVSLKSVGSTLIPISIKDIDPNVLAGKFVVLSINSQVDDIIEILTVFLNDRTKLYNFKIIKSNSIYRIHSIYESRIYTEKELKTQLRKFENYLNIKEIQL